MNGKVILDRYGLDYSGTPCGPAGLSFELCDVCVMDCESMLFKFKAEKVNT
jgi:hypothetical protein